MSDSQYNCLTTRLPSSGLVGVDELQGVSPVLRGRLGGLDTTDMLGSIQFDENGNLPAGEHTARWEDIERSFGTGGRRGELLRGLLELLRDLRSAGVQDVWLDGSFTTDDPDPHDYDLCWSRKGADVDRLPREFGYRDDVSVSPDLSNHELLRRRYRGDVLMHLPPHADVVGIFTHDRDGNERGIIKVDMSSIP